MKQEVKHGILIGGAHAVTGDAAVDGSGACRYRRSVEQVSQRLNTSGDGHAPLAATITVAERDGVVGQALAIDRDAEGSAGLILATIATADRPLLVVED